MHRIIIASVLAGAGLFFGIAVALADGGPHGNYSTTTTACGSCHRAHTAQADKLLRMEASDLCLFCHDGSGAGLDVWDGADLAVRFNATTMTKRPLSPLILPAVTVGPGTPTPTPAVVISGALRGGGFVYARMDYTVPPTATPTLAPGAPTSTPGPTATFIPDPGKALANTEPGVPVTSAHVKFGTPGTNNSFGNGLTPLNIIWGSGALSSTANGGKKMTSALTCADCHNPHGNGSYRILRPIPKPMQGDITTGVLLTDEPSPKEYSTENYWTQYAVGATTPWTASDISNWCSTCHTRYNTSSSDNSGDAIFKYRHKSDGTSSMGGKTGAPYGATVFSTQCLQCHVAHGSSARMSGTQILAMPWPSDPNTNTTAPGPARGAESTLLKINGRGTCVACHGTKPGS